jgi:hypothetical protein
MTYTKQTWSDNNPAFPASAARFDYIEQGIYDAHNSIANVLYVKEYGAVGDGSTDDTAAIQAALNAMVDRTTLVFERGKTYSVSNLVLPNLTYLTLQGNGAKIISNGTGDSTYLIASYNWVNNVGTSGNPFVRLQDFELKGNAGSVPTGGKDNVLVIQSRRFHLLRCEVWLGATNGVLIDAQTKNGTDLSDNMVEIRIVESRMHDCGVNNFYSHDPTTYRITDVFFRDNICYNAGTANVKIDKASGWLIDGLHTYQLGGTGVAAVFTPGSQWDVDIEDVGVALRFQNGHIESGCVIMKAITQTHSPVIMGNVFGLSAPSGALARLQSSVSGGNDSAVSLIGNEFCGPTSGGNYCTLFVTGPSSGDPLRVYILGGRFGFRNPVSWSQQVKVFTRGLSVYQSSQNVPADLIVDGYMPTSGARPPGIVYRTAAPSTGTEVWVVGDRVLHPTPAVGSPPEWVVTTAGATGTAVFTAKPNL